MQKIPLSAFGFYHGQEHVRVNSLGDGCSQDSWGGVGGRQFVVDGRVAHHQKMNSEQFFFMNKEVRRSENHELDEQPSRSDYQDYSGCKSKNQGEGLPCGRQTPELFKGISHIMQEEGEDLMLGVAGEGETSASKNHLVINNLSTQFAGGDTSSLILQHQNHPLKEEELLATLRSFSRLKVIGREPRVVGG